MTNILKAAIVALLGIPSAALAADALRVGKVDVADRLPMERKERWAAIGGQAALERALTAELAHSGLLDATGGSTLVVTVQGYRMRPGTTPAWSGIGRAARPHRSHHLPDGDALDLAIAVRDGNRVLRTYQVAVTTPDTAGPRDTTARMARLAQAGARRVTEQIATN